MIKKLAIIGSGDLGRLIAYHAGYAGFKVAGFFNDYEVRGKSVDNIPVLGGQNDVETLYKDGQFDELMIGIGYKHFQVREELFKRFSSHIPFANVIHKSVAMADSCAIGKGNFILPSCSLDNNAVLKDNVLMNIGAVIAHDSVIESHTFLSPRVAIAGFVHIGKSCNIGINATIIDNISITSNTQIGGGAVVIKDIFVPGLYVGNPAKFIR